jgi:DNA recombination protein RmuC
MNTSSLFLFFILLLGALAVFYYFLRKLLLEKQSTDQQQKELEDMVNKVFGMTANKIALQSKTILAGEKDTIKTDLANKQEVIEKLVKQLQEDMKDRQDEIREIEKKQIDKISQVTTAVEEHRKLTDELRVSTQQLAKVLSNNQTRGAWGERIIEDLLQANGLQEGLHYLRQSRLGDSAMKPDITLLLPDKRNVPVDVKFPYQEVQKMSLTEDRSERNAHMQQFKRDLKVKVDKVAAYISPENDTLDYAILFVPNEMLFSFINQKFPDIVDEALAKKVLLCSPFSFLAVARTVMESYRNFMMGKKVKEVIKHIDAFVIEWQKYQQEFDKLGSNFDKVAKSFTELSGVRRRQLDKKIEKIDQYRGAALPESSENRQLIEKMDE